MLWLYAIAESGFEARLDGASGPAGELRVVGCGELAVIVEEVEEPRKLRVETLREHDRIVRRLASKLPSLLPARFGQTVADADALKRQLADEQFRLGEALDLVRGCVQVTVQIHGQIPGQIQSDEPGAQDADRAEDSSTGAGRRYLHRRLHQRLAQRRITGLDELQRHLQPWVRDTRSRRGPEPALASAYHLVPKEDADRMLAAARDFVPPGDLRLRVGEPAPAYAFASPSWSVG